MPGSVQVHRVGSRRVDQRRPQRGCSRLNAAGDPKSVDVELSDVLLNYRSFKGGRLLRCQGPTPGSARHEPA
eukprot:4532561-Pyramimonas_sp.AAC.1